MFSVFLFCFLVHCVFAGTLVLRRFICQIDHEPKCAFLYPLTFYSSVSISLIVKKKERKRKIPILWCYCLRVQYTYLNNFIYYKSMMMMMIICTCAYSDFKVEVMMVPISMMTNSKEIEKYFNNV